jgi:hypothetical protein
MMCVPYWQEGKEATEKHLFHRQRMEQSTDFSPCETKKTHHFKGCLRSIYKIKFNTNSKPIA